MPSSSKNVKLGICQVFYDGIDRGLTQGGVEVTVATETHRVEVDQFGKSAINETVQGRTLTVKVPMAETTARNLVDTMPGSQLISDGAQASGTVTLAAQPTATTSVTIAGQAFSFQLGKPTSVYQVQIGASLAESLANLAKAISLSNLRGTDLGGIKAAVSGPTTVCLTVADPGVLGNAVTLVASNGATVSGATFTGGVNETKVRVEVGSGVGVDLLSIAKPLRLHPVGKPATDFSEDFYVYQAATPGALTFAYKTDAERIYNVEFSGYPDPQTLKLFSIGDLLA
jgi:hypothetical protein